MTDNLSRWMRVTKGDFETLKVSHVYDTGVRCKFEVTNKYSYKKNCRVEVYINDSYFHYYTKDLDGLWDTIVAYIPKHLGQWFFDDVYHEYRGIQ